MPPRSFPLALIALAVALTGVIVACGSGDDDGNGEETVTETVTEPAPDLTETAPDDGAGEDRDEGRSGGEAFRGCLDIDRDGTINMGGAGTVELQRSGNRLSVSNVQPAEGWRSSVERDDDGDEVEVKFRRGGEEIEMEAEIDDGRLEVEVCRN